MKLRSALLAATVLALPIAAHAQMTMPNLTGFYVGAEAGANFLIPVGIASENGNSPFDSRINTNPGAIGVGYVGYTLGNGLSLRLDGDVMGNQFGKVETGSGALIAHGSGWEQKQGAMLDVMFDLSPYMNFMGIAPYAGLGVGYQWSLYRNVNFAGTVLAPGNLANVNVNNRTEGAFAYGVILGAQYPIGYTGLALTLEYRFMGVLARTVPATFTFAGEAPGAGAPGKIQFKQEFNNAVLVGVKYTFGVTPPPAPAPAPVAAPAPAPARSYLVFVDWDKATLTDRAREIIREAAENSRRVQYTVIEVNGYTDTSGTAAYNLKLSVRRAESVAAELVRDGVPRNVIAIRGFGETHLLVPTGPGVREPQNRRVEIIIR